MAIQRIRGFAFMCYINPWLIDGQAELAWVGGWVARRVLNQCLTHNAHSPSTTCAATLDQWTVVESVAWLVSWPPAAEPRPPTHTHLHTLIIIIIIIKWLSGLFHAVLKLYKQQEPHNVYIQTAILSSSIWWYLSSYQFCSCSLSPHCVFLGIMFHSVSSSPNNPLCIKWYVITHSLTPACVILLSVLCVQF